MRIPEDIKKALDECGKPWTIEHGKRHQKIKINKRLVGVMSLGATKDGQAGRGSANIIAQIRRATKETA